MYTVLASMLASSKPAHLSPGQETSIRKELDAILSGSHFAGSKRCSDFLEFIVKQALAGNFEHLSERFLGVELFGRPVDYETATDSVVRVRATDVRHRLVRHYAEYRPVAGVTIQLAPGTYIPEFRWAALEEVVADPSRPAAKASVHSGDPDAPLVVEIPRGSFIPVIQGRASAADDGTASTAAAQAKAAEGWLSPAHPPFHRIGIPQRAFVVGAAASVFIVLALGITSLTLWQELRAAHRIIYPWQSSPAVAEFWGTFLRDQKSTDFVMADASYSLLQALANKSFTLDEYLSHNYVNQLQDSDPRMAAALERISNWGLGSPSEFEFAQRILALDPAHQRIHLYSARKYMPDLIAHDNVLLVGSRYGNPWAELFENRANFIFDPKDPYRILNRAPAKGEPSSFEFSASGASGYCILAYLPAPDGKALLIQGSSGESTQAAGDFLLSESRMAEFRKLLGGSHFPYFELLLKTSWVKGTPINSSIVAYRVYPTSN